VVVVVGGGAVERNARLRRGGYQTGGDK